MATAALTLAATVSGLPEGGTDSISFAISNSSAANTVTLKEVTTAQGLPTAVVMPSSAKFMLMIPPSTNTFSYRVTGTTAEAGILLSSRDGSFFSAPGGSSFYVYTTGGTTFILRCITY